MALKKANTSATGAQVQTVTVVNELGADKELVFTLKNATANDISLVKLFNPLGTVDTTTTNTTFASTEFASFAEMQKLFSFISTNVSDVIIQTDDTDNFVGNLVVSEKDPSGHVSTVKIDISKFRQATGGGYSETVKVPLGIVIWPGLNISLSTLKATSEVTFRFKVTGWNKSQELVALRSNML